MFTPVGLGRSLSRLLFDKREMKLRNAAHPCNGLLGLFLTSKAIKNIFIEGKGETLKLF